jgi:hypothetical protein
MDGEYSTYGGDVKYKILVEKYKGKKPLGRPRRRWEDHNKAYLRQIGCGNEVGFTCPRTEIGIWLL